MIPDYREGVQAGTLVSRGMFDQITSDSVILGRWIRRQANWQCRSPGIRCQPGTSNRWILFSGIRVFVHICRISTLYVTGGGIPMADEVTPQRNPVCCWQAMGLRPQRLGPTTPDARPGPLEATAEK